MTRKGKCSMAGCHDEANCVGLCVNCYSYVRYWLRKTPRQVISRAERVALWQTRLETVIPKRVTRIRKRRAAAR